ncbi:protein FAM219A-like [Tubulanus polymorphus]|uniref:protein FAM219A-like n=1 Tax=Tubulanus polymorphus TaxID=672921 RepID=UPI003DA49225
MDSMEDSGFDSDPKTSSNGSTTVKHHSPVSPKGSNKGTGINIRRPSDLQKKIEKQREIARKSAAIIDQPTRKPGLLSMSRLKIPQKGGHTLLLHSDIQPLVAIQSDDSEDEFESPIFSKISNQDITQQLIKDGYNLDLQPDDEDLDLIPPKSFNERCVCCNPNTASCVIQ